MSEVVAQDRVYPSHLRVRGTLATCAPIRFLDMPSSVYIRAIVDSTLPDSTTDAVLYCMQVRSVLDSAVEPIVDVPGVVGTRIPVTIISRTDSVVILQPRTTASIDPTAVYQLVLPIQADTITIDSTLTCEAWNGVRGGVIELHASSVIIFDSARVDVSSLGHRGGRRSADGGSCSLTQACDPPLSGRTAEKGESIVVRDPQCWSGHIPWASGGGGGDAHNSGGGGGGNGGSGGRGGDQWSCGLPLGMHGMAGCAVRDTTFDRVVFGGGGGGGHQNNGVGSDGASGGGIIVLRAPHISGDTVRVAADGENNTRAASNDGGGAGGAGGTIVFDACTISAPLSASIRGGRGGNCGGGHGPGGGGGGGRILIEPSFLQRIDSTLQFSIEGGASGLNGGATATFNAMPGEPGIIVPLCARVSTHRVSSAKELAIGTVDTLMIASRDASSRCPVMITHTVTIVGYSLLPMVDSMRYDARVQVQLDRRAPDTAIVLVTLPSTISTMIPLLGLLHQDTTSLIRHTALVTFPDSIPSCTWPSEERVVVTRACGLPIRVVRPWTPLQIRVTSKKSSAELIIDAASTAPIDLSVVDLQGRLVSILQCTSFERITDHTWRGRINLPYDTLGRGVYAVSASSQQGTVVTTFAVTE